MSLWWWFSKQMQWEQIEGINLIKKGGGTGMYSLSSPSLPVVKCLYSTEFKFYD
jgi:hypothetical protein